MTIPPSNFMRIVLISFLTICHIAPRAMAAPPHPVASKIQRNNVPDDHISAWAREVKNLIAISRAEFEQLLKGNEAETHSSAAQITSAHYTATVAGRALRDGRAKLTVHRTGGTSVLLPLSHFSLAVRDLGWSDHPAVWGADDLGDVWLLADVPKGEIQIAWSAAARSLTDDLDFDLQFPPAEASVFDIRVPRDQTVRSTPEARRVDEGSDANWQTWRLQLGSERRCRIAVSSIKPVSERRPTILFENEMGAIVREEDLRFQTVFQVEVFDAPITELVFTVPSSVDVFAITYAQDVPLAWTRSGKSEAAGTVTVRLPGQLQGRIRPIRIDGVASQKPNASMVSPHIAVKDGVFISGRQTLTIVAPLQLRSFRPSGFRQQTPPSSSPDGESYTFLQLLPDAQLVLDVGRPPTTLNAQVHCVFETNDSASTLTSELTWTATSGNVFQTECSFPADWEITDVRLTSKRGTARLAGFDVSAQAGGTSLLTVEFLEALSPSDPPTIRVLARRRPAAAGTSFAFPMPQPVGCHSVESTLALVLPSSLSPFISDDARAERIPPPDDNFLPNVRTGQLTSNQSEYWYRRESTEASGTIQLVSRLRRIVASSETFVNASQAEYTEWYRIRCQADGAPVDRLLVYLTERGNEIRWSMQAPRSAELTALRLPEDQHPDWSLPKSGELWELRLPPLPSGEVEIEGRRGNRWAAVSHPALLVVPQALDRRSQVTLSRPISLELIVESNRLTEFANTVSPDKESMERSTDDTGQQAAPASPRERTTIWKFDKPEAELALSLQNRERSREFPTMVSMRLRSLLSANPQGFDLYRARIRMENGATEDEIRIRLDPSAVLQQVTVAGQATVPTVQGDELLISDLNAADHDVVELLYRVPSRGGTLRDEHRIVVPQISSQVLAFQWEFALPPSLRIYTEPRGVRLSRPLPTPALTERIFGPIGRPRDEQFFNPFAKESWQALLQASNTSTTSIGRFDRELIAPVEWQIYSAVSASVPEEIRIETWQSHQARLLEWISLATNLIIGIVLRMIGWKYRDRGAAYWLAALSAGAFFAPSPFAQIAGGAIAGTMIALLLPRRSLITPRRDPSQMVPLGSTHSFDWRVSASILLLSFWLSLKSVAQDTTTSSSTISPSNPTTSPAGTASGSRPAVMKIFVPVDSSGKPSANLPVVYLPQALLTSLKEGARAKAMPQTLIGSARYDVTLGANGGDSLTAKFRVHVLDTSADRQILLSIPDSFLINESACRLNGRQYPVVATPDGHGFSVNWTPKLIEPADDGTISQPLTASFDIELDLKRVGVRNARGGTFTADVPSVAASVWSLTLPESVPHFEVTGEQGATSTAADRRSYEIDFGAASHIEARWSRTQPDARTRRIKVSQLQFLDLRATNSELRFRIRCDPTFEQRDAKDELRDAIDFVDLDLPARCLVREGDIRSTNFLRTELLVDPQGRQQLRIVFSEPQRQKFVIDGTLLIPGDDAASFQPLPHFGLSRSATLQPTTVQNWWCVNTSTEFRLDHQNLDPDLLGTITPAEFLQSWGEAPPTGRHQLIFQHREGILPGFAITPQVPRRRAITWVQTGFIGKRRLDWTLSAKIESTQIPVYQHVLLVDRRLQIESISVVVNGAERVVSAPQTRHGNSPTRIVVFLNDKTSGMQQLTVKASLPTRYGRPTPLPFIKCEEIEQLDSRWELFRDPDIEVELDLPRGVPPFETPEESLADEGPQLIARYQTTDPDPKTFISVSARQARCNVRTAAVLTRTQGAGWKLVGQIKLTPLGESARRLGVLFPAGAYDPERIRVERAEATWHDPADGRRRLDLALLPETDEVSISFETDLEEPVRGDWELPIPEPQEVVSHDVHLLMSPADAWTPFVGTELKPDETPTWAEDFLSELKPELSTAEYRLNATPIRLRRDQTSMHQDQPEIRLLDHTIWLSRNGEQHGITRAFLSQLRDTIQFQIPDGLNLISVFLDDRPLAMPEQTDNQVRIPLVGVARESILTLTWKQTPRLPQAVPPDSAQSQTAWSRACHFFSNAMPRVQNEPLPWPTNIDVNRSLLTYVPDRNELAVMRGGIQNLDWIGAALDRLEVLLARQESLGNDPRAAVGNRALIDELQSQIESRLAQRAAQSAPPAAAQLKRWSQIVHSLNRLEPLSSAQNTPNRESRPSYVEDLLNDLPVAIRTAVADDDRNVGCWIFDQQWVASIAAVLLCLLAIPVLRRLIRLDWGQWLTAHSSVAWLLLGVVWWLWLTPGVVGPLIIAVAIFRIVTSPRIIRSTVLIEEA